jgi:hypothetical protein
MTTRGLREKTLYPLHRYFYLAGLAVMNDGFHVLEAKQEEAFVLTVYVLIHRMYSNGQCANSGQQLHSEWAVAVPDFSLANSDGLPFDMHFRIRYLHF